MVEYIRSIRIRLEVDTNKRTEVIERELESLNDIEDVAGEMIERIT